MSEPLDLDAIMVEVDHLTDDGETFGFMIRATDWDAVNAEVRRLRALLEAFGGEEEISKRIAIMQEIRADPFAVLMARAVITQEEALRRYLGR